jgi:hypothetical protein
MKSVMSSWGSSQKDKKAQNNKRKLSDNDTSDSEQDNSASFKHAKIGIPIKEVIGETTINSSKKALRILTDTGSSSSTILNKFINKSL